MKRRDFLRSSALVSGSLFLPAFLKSAEGMPMFSGKQRRLVVVQLTGGNDGLNTIVPYANDLYYRARPTIAVPRQDVITISDEMGFNKAFAPLQALVERGEMSVVNNVGYPNPDRSHFRSMDIWHTAADSKEYLSTGWLGRYLDLAGAEGEKPHLALELDDSLSLALKGAKRSGLAASHPEKLKEATKNPILRGLHAQHGHATEESIAYLYGVMSNTMNSADYLYEKSRVYTSKQTYPQHDFGKDLKQIAELITADTDTRIYYVSLTGFDTHANQRTQQERLLGIYAEAMAAFVSDLKQNGLFEDTLIFTFSEFGRRVEENASRGTDHGTASNAYFIGGKLKKAGILGKSPNLMDLDEGDLKYQTDFRSLYVNILRNWLGVNDPSIVSFNAPALGLF